MKVVVLSDLRFFTIVTAIQILMESSSDCLLVSEEVISNQEFGSNSKKFIKSIKIWLISKFLPVEVVKTESQLVSKQWRGEISSLVSQMKDASASEKKYPEFAANFKRQACGAVSVFNALKMKGVKEIFVFNGRFSSSQPICELAMNNGIKIWYYEWGVIPFHFTIKSVPTHDFVSHAKLVIAIYENKSLFSGYYMLSHKIDQFIGNKLNNRFTNTYTVGVDQNYDVTIFLGSPHELLAVLQSGYMTDIQFCNAVVEKYGKVRYAIRSHPNQVNDPSWINHADQLETYARSIGADFYGPDSAINSYQLIKKSSVVATYHSSISVDAFFLGAKVDVFGESMYKYFIEYCNDDRATPSEKNDRLATLLQISMYAYQHPIHPKWAIFMKLFGWIDRKVVRYLDL